VTHCDLEAFERDLRKLVDKKADRSASDVPQIPAALCCGPLFPRRFHISASPAVVTLLGDRAWWLPAWLDRALPNVSLEGRRPETVEVEPEREKALV
jgi:hypothetical protein